MEILTFGFAWNCITYRMQRTPDHLSVAGDFFRRCLQEMPLEMLHRLGYFRAKTEYDIAEVMRFRMEEFCSVMNQTLRTPPKLAFW